MLVRETCWPVPDSVCEHIHIKNNSSGQDATDGHMCACTLFLLTQKALGEGLRVIMHSCTGWYEGLRL